MRLMASSRSMVVSSGIARTPSSMIAPIEASRASSAFFRNAGARKGCNSAHALSGWVKRFSPTPARIGTTGAGGRIHGSRSLTSMVRETAGSVITHAFTGPRRSATTGPSAAASSSHRSRSASNIRSAFVIDRCTFTTGATAALHGAPIHDRISTFGNLHRRGSDLASGHHVTLVAGDTVHAQ